MVENIQSLYNLSMKVTASKEGASLPECLNPTTNSTYILCVVGNGQNLYPTDCYVERKGLDFRNTQGCSKYILVDLDNCMPGFIGH